MEQIKVLTSSSIIINRLAFLLDQENIQTIVKDNVESARLAGFGSSHNGVELYVYSADLEKAQRIIDSFNDESYSG